LGFCAISSDSVEILADFSRRKSITFPMLADPQSKIIRDFGILNTTVPKDNWRYGIPYPGTYRVNEDGIVQSKYFAADFQERYSAPTILLQEFGSVAGTRQTEVKTDYFELKYYSTLDVVRPNVHFTLVADFDLKPKMHVYAPGVEHYIPINLELDRSTYYSSRPAEYPRAQTVHLPAINETVPVYVGKFRIRRDVIMQGRDSLGAMPEVKIKGRLRFQACDEKICYLPQTVNLEWVVKLETLTSVIDRVPEKIQRGVADAPYEGTP
jgi:AhpC/TSA family protein/cytochrome c biogenesis DsbD-like protein